MKELEKTKRISIAAVLLILVIIIALLSYKRPKHMYVINSMDTLERITNHDYLIFMEEIDHQNSVLIDLRNRFDYEKGHLENAINIPTSDLLSEPNLELLDNIKDKKKVMILYGKSPDDVNTPFMLLYQLGYSDIKILSIHNFFTQNVLISKNIRFEDTVANILAFIEESEKKAEKAKKAQIVVKKVVPKKIVVKKKKKKMPVEGGC
jgi:rhodanese-related sulfurtransferase